jgi:hypothetical protein
MFRSRINPFRPTLSHPLNTHPACPEPRREHTVGSALPGLVPNPSDLCALCVSALSSLPFTLSQNNAKLTPLFSYSSALFEKECFSNPFPVNHFRTLLQNTGGVPQKSNPSSPRFRRFAPNPFTICTSVKPARNPFRIRTSKTQDLKSFRIRTYEKRGEGVPYHPDFSCLSAHLHRSILRTAP